MSTRLPKQTCVGPSLLALLCATLLFNRCFGNDIPAGRRGIHGRLAHATPDREAAEGRLPDDVSIPQVWKPSKSRPLPVFEVYRFSKSGVLGLSNILWVEARAIDEGCAAAEKAMKGRQPLVDNGTLPLGFPVVILPPLRKDLGRWREQDVPMHEYSDLFDLDYQQRFTIHYKNCYITDINSFTKLRADGLLHHAKGTNDVELKMNRMEASSWRALHSPILHKLYQGLTMSSRIRKMYYEPCLCKIRGVFHNNDTFYAAVHMRVEDDFLNHCKKYERMQKRRYCIGAGEIAEIVLRTPEVSGHRNFLTMYAAHSFNQTHPGRTGSMTVDPMQAWPEDAALANPYLLQCFKPPTEGEALSYTERSVISMFLAAEADIFIGSSLSSMHRGVAMIRSRPGNERESFIYDTVQSGFKVAMKTRDNFQFYEDAPPSLMH